MASNGLYRSKDDRILAGVCGGIAQSMSANVWLIRIVFIIIAALLFGIGGLVIYILAWLLMKEQPEETKAAPQEQHIPFKGDKQENNPSPIKPKDGAGIR